MAYREARDAVTKALALDPASGEAHAVLAMLKFLHDFDWAGAEAGFKLALELSPGAADIYDHYGWLCSALGRNDEALALVARAQELDPLMHRSDLATELLRAGRIEEALQAALRCVEVEPQYARGRATLGWAYFKGGNVEEGLAQLHQAAALAPENNLYLAQLGQAYGLAGQPDKAREVLQRLTNWPAGSMSLLITWPTSIPVSASTTLRSTCWSVPSRSTPAACTASRDPSCSRRCTPIPASRHCSGR